MTNSPTTKNVLLIADASSQSDRLQPLAAALRTLGHHVVLCLDTDAALAQTTPDALVIDAGSTDNAKANLAITTAFQGGVAPMRFVAILDEANFEACRDALRAGANDVFAGIFDLDQVITSICVTDEVALEAAALPSRELHRAFTSNRAGQSDFCRELTACATRAGISRSHRFRVVTAAAEVAANAGLHAYEGGEGPLFLSANFAGDCATVEVRDLGIGFAPEDTALNADESCHGLDIAAGLAEHLHIDSTSAGTKITMEFHLTPTHFDEEPASGEDLDYLTPAATRRFLGSPSSDGAEFIGSALASTVGRILLASASQSSDRAQTALWS
ncbi:MAG: anti-sigma regulatory factor (Ser/Thr protein kinase) [Bacteroidia bacterium]|jgi:anti-sigma regulatory factor (Ser/Thr protein kinase)